MVNGKTISLCLPCRNEAKHLKKIVQRIPSYIDEVIIISNASTDHTLQVAKKLDKKVRVIEDNRTVGGIGYGFAHMSGVAAAKGDIIVGADADGTYPIHRIDEIVNYLLASKLDFVLCSRYPVKNKGAIPLKLRAGVALLNLETRMLYGVRISDILSGMWVFRRSAKSKLGLSMGEWNLSPQIKINAATNPSIYYGEFHISQNKRMGKTKQDYFKTGLSHALWIFRNRFIKS